MVSHFKGGYVKSIMKLFPEIGLDENKFYDYTGTSKYSSYFLLLLLSFSSLSLNSLS